MNTKNNKVKAGAKAGSVQAKRDGAAPVWRVWVKGKPLSASRVILLIFGYEINNKIVDHLDGNSLNNRLENLRLVSYVENNRNKKKSKNNKTGHTGIFFETLNKKSGKTYSYFVAFYTNEAKKEIRKRFSIDTLGEELALSLAKNFRDLGVALSESYTERHGK